VLHGVVADPVSADVVKMNVKLMNSRNVVPITAAVCEKISDELLLSSGVVNRSREQFENEDEHKDIVNQNVNEVGMVTIFKRKIMTIMLKIQEKHLLMC